MHPLAPSWVLHASPGPIMSLQTRNTHMHESCNDIFWPQRIHSMISPEFCWNRIFSRNYAGFSLKFGIWRNSAGRPKNLAEFRKFRWRKICSKYIQNVFKIYSKYTQGHFHIIFMFTVTVTKNESFQQKIFKIYSKYTHGHFGGNLILVGIRFVFKNVWYRLTFEYNCSEIKLILQNPSDFLESSEII